MLSLSLQHVRWQWGVNDGRHHARLGTAGLAYDVVGGTAGPGRQGRTKLGKSFALVRIGGEAGQPLKERPARDTEYVEYPVEELKGGGVLHSAPGAPQWAGRLQPETRVWLNYSKRIKQRLGGLWIVAWEHGQSVAWLVSNRETSEVHLEMAYLQRRADSMP